MAYPEKITDLKPGKINGRAIEENRPPIASGPRCLR